MGSNPREEREGNGVNMEGMGESEERVAVCEGQKREGGYGEQDGGR